MKHALFKVKASSYTQIALQELLNFGLLETYFIKESHSTLIGGLLQIQPREPFKYSTLIEYDLPIDWDHQWKLHCPYYKEGLVTIPLKNFGAPSEAYIELKPGPGFGDLSHPTTHLTLSAMATKVQGACVLDIGCGSGILSVAAHKLGAKKVIGLDIDNQALTHAISNAHLNRCYPAVEFLSCFDAQILKQGIWVVCLNMLWHEQKQVFSYYPTLDFKGVFIISGVLQEQQEAYLQAFPYSNFHLTDSSVQEGWSLLILSN
jgi:ribosomal protein L11 methyltransferase